MIKSLKFLKFFNIFLIGILGCGVATTVAICTYSLLSPSETTKEIGPFQYNEDIIDFSQTPKILDNNQISISPEQRKQAEIDKKALDFYQTYSRSIAITKYNDTTSTLGTIWAYPNPNNDHRYWFVTNIHVIKDLLYLTNDNVLNQSIINSNFSIRVNSFRDTQSYDTPLRNVKIERIALTDKYSSAFSNSYYLNGNKFTNEPYNYSDFAILSSTVNPFSSNISSYDMDFVDTPEEYIRAKNAEYLYIAGFPVISNPSINKITDFITAKYKVKKSGSEQTTFGSTAVEQFGGITNYMNNDKTWLDIFVNGDYTRPGFLSFASQLIMPNLNLGGGSSGSVICFYDPEDDKIKPLSIWWGVYEKRINGKLVEVKGASDLFFTNDYYIGNKKVQGYSNLYDLMWNTKTKLNFY